MKYTLIIAALSISFASIHCMEELELSKNAPPAYYQTPIVANTAATIPQGTDTYMTYREFWDKNKVPQDVQQKSMREQEKWMAQQEIIQGRKRAFQMTRVWMTAWQHGRQEGLEEEECSFYKGACVAGAICFVGMKGIWLLIP